MESRWKHCPVCGQSVDGVLDNPYLVTRGELSQQDQEDRQVVYEQANQDLRNTGLLLQIMAYGLALGFGYYLFNGRLLRRGSFDTITFWILIVTFICVILSVIGMVMGSYSGSKSDRSAVNLLLQSLAIGLKLLFIIGSFILLWIFAMVIYLLETCGCIG
jgi:hypothetical protein